MAQQEEDWPLCLQPLNSRVGLVRNCNFAGSVNTLLNGSSSSSTDSSSSLDIESQVSILGLVSGPTTDMDWLDTSQPITTILEGPNYIIWAQAMSSFLKGCKLWRYVTGDITEPKKQDAETDDKFHERLEDWDSKNHQIITCFRNTSVTSISLQFGRFKTAKHVWDFLANRYTITDPVHLYQLQRTLYGMRQKPGQSINNFLSQMYIVWGQLSSSEPKWSCRTDADKFSFYRDKKRLVLFLMALHDDFEPVRASLLRRSPLPSLEQAISQLLLEETRLNTRKTQQIVLATQKGTRSTPRGSQFSRSAQNFCRYCSNTSHILLDCPIRVCKFCHKFGPGHYHNECPCNPKRKHHFNPSRGNQSKSGPHFTSQSAVAATKDSQNSDVPTSSISVTDLEAIFKRVLAHSDSSTSTAFYVTQGTRSTDRENSWDRP